MVDLRRVTRLCERELRRHGLAGWTFRLSRIESRVGRCFHDLKKIDMSRPFAFLNTWELIRDVMLHEIAHALVGAGHGHDKFWEAKARELGCVHGLGSCLVATDALYIPSRKKEDR